MAEEHAPAHEKGEISRAIGIIEVLHKAGMPYDW
jgi:hypothetical protein